MDIILASISWNPKLFTRICRTCLCGTTDHNLFLTTDSNKTSLKAILEASTALKISIEDKLPHHICDGCLKAIEAAYSFRNQSQQIDGKLKCLLKRMHTIKNDKCIEIESIPCTSVVIPTKAGKVKDILQIEGIATSSFQCIACHLNFTNQMDLDKHNAAHSLASGMRFKCKICSETFQMESEFIKHLQDHRVHVNHLKTHSKSEASMCHTCGRTYFSQREFLDHLKTHEQERKPINLNESESENAISYLEKMPTESNDLAFKLKSARATELHMKSSLNNKEANNYADLDSGMVPGVVSISSSTNTDSVNNIANGLGTSKEQNCLKKKNVEVSSTSVNEQVQSACDQAIRNEPSIRSDITVDDKNSMLEHTNSKRQSWMESGLDFEVTIKKEKSDDGYSLSKISNELHTDSDPPFHQLTEDSTHKIVKEPPVGFDIVIKEEKSDDDLSTFNVTSAALSNNESLADQSKHDTAQTSWEETSKESVITINKEKSEADKIKNEPLSDDEPSFKHSGQDSTEISSASFTCTIPHCKMEFKYERDIINHYKSQHCVGPPPFKCPVCVKVFLTPSQVRRHMSSHITSEQHWNGEEQFKCPKCPKRFSQECALKTHSRTHSIFKEYKCNVCPKVYLSHSGLFRHAKSHVEIKELECGFCTKQFPSKSNLRRHQERVHGENHTSEHTTFQMETDFINHLQEQCNKNSQTTELESNIRSHTPPLGNQLNDCSQRELFRHPKTHEQEQKPININEFKSENVIYCQEKMPKESNDFALKLNSAKATELHMKSSLNNKEVNNYADLDSGMVPGVVSISSSTNTDSVNNIANGLGTSKEQNCLKKKNVEVSSSYDNQQVKPTWDQTIRNEPPIGSDITVDDKNSMLTNEQLMDAEQSLESPVEFDVTVKKEKPDDSYSLSKIELHTDSDPPFHKLTEDSTHKIVKEPPVGFDIVIKEEKSDDDLSTFNVTSAADNYNELFDQSKQDTAQTSWEEMTKESGIIINKEKSEADKIKIEPLSDDGPSFKHSREDSTEISSASFTCTIPHCKMEFKYERDIINHYKSQHCVGPPPFKCPVCVKVFLTPSQVRRHMSSHISSERHWNSEVQFKCPKCPKRFSQECALRSHSRIHNVFKKFKCNVCTKIYFSYSGLVRHTTSHFKIKELECDFCCKQFPTKFELRRHQDRLHGGNHTSEHTKVVVEELNASRETNCFKYKKSESSTALDNQLVQIAQDSTIWKEPPVGFDIITKQEDESDGYPSTYNVTNKPLSDDESSSYQPTHDSTQKSWKEPPVGLDIVVKEEKSDACDLMFRITNEPLSDDEQSFDQSKQDSTQKIENELPVGFDITVLQEMPDDDASTFKITNVPLNGDDEEPFVQLNQRPIELSSGARYANFPCVISQCKEKFKYNRDIINHYISQHDEGSLPFKCPVCAEVVAIKREVRSHLKSHVVVEYKCEYCSRECGTAGNLIRHLPTHTGERPYECPKCPKRFKTRAALRVHIKTHNTHKEYKCNSCSKEFYSKNGLFLHARSSHTENKELQCNICGRQFPIKSRLQRHLQGLCGTRTSANSLKES